jgi:tripartite-type tricarboxylate transporter receptor subunit TctC
MRANCASSRRHADALGADPERAHGCRDAAGLRRAGLVWPGVPARYAPQPVIDKLRGALKEVLSRDAVKKKLEGVGAVANLSTPEEFKKTIESDINGFKEVAGKAGLQAN